MAQPASLSSGARKALPVGLACILFAGLLFMACQPASRDQVPDLVLTAAWATVNARRGQTLTPPSPVLTTSPTARPTREPAIPPTVAVPAALRGSQPDTEPLRYTFPTPGPQPVSAWRPPLYDVPWAPGPYDHFFFRRPIAADEVNWPVADYRYGGVFPDSEIIHTGIDIDAPLNTPVLAAAAGRVVWTGYGLFRGVYDTQDPYGLAVALRHEFGYQGDHLYTVYAHMKEIDVVMGQELKSGEVLGRVGNTGKTTGPHLHFEVRVQGNDFYRSRNPELWLAPPQGWGVLVGRLTKPDGTYLYNKEVLVMTPDKFTTWLVRSYGPQAVNNDPYYHENMVLSDLPAGDYTIWIQYDAARYNLDVHIFPGQVTYFTFNGKNLFRTDPPKVEGPDTFQTPGP